MMPSRIDLDCNMKYQCDDVWAEEDEAELINATNGSGLE